MWRAGFLLAHTAAAGRYMYICIGHVAHVQATKVLGLVIARSSRLGWAYVWCALKWAAGSMWAGGRSASGETKKETSVGESERPFRRVWACGSSWPAMSSRVLLGLSS